ncbi:hypothetical protein VIBNISFn27_750130 [Vibrio nigripulchritudo SFn27]|uniref:Uncharacterized protein n=1 Tax=Vibrio nigripulchritudo TaxID=28173 RepID=U4K823_9VIBR|nr:hypothetical protein VIBNIBLFn1_550015 [Vibrio nigripulchritudo BLFn1]CCN90760.1 hypothetical protein VIBNISFn27_750130 [Vibrio nigripulchritudo SFn27]CCN97347.1 hypothetical protein VIBNIENn2_920129 [Vibrio nigripulchritudo ENn2]CCO39983.1 hypothetical protein VIBNISFn135_200130 [Vibrio nigripulchritudo SFn135]CCO51123.1 hypothetical protein VIBNIWn13_1070130 [Vibrio nigripulchritudo Wn13]CCO61497.1 hypothetical protein VIBNI_B1771 [Vibrio nigripulchritudo]
MCFLLIEMIHSWNQSVMQRRIIRAVYITESKYSNWDESLFNEFR